MTFDEILKQAYLENVDRGDMELIKLLQLTFANIEIDSGGTATNGIAYFSSADSFSDIQDAIADGMLPVLNYYISGIPAYFYAYNHSDVLIDFVAFYGTTIYKLRWSSDDTKALSSTTLVSNQSPQFYGSPTAFTPAENDSSTKLATTQFVNRAINNLPIADIVDAWLESQSGAVGTFSYAAKEALLMLLRHVAYTDEYGMSYYNNLYNALYPPSQIDHITAVFTQGNNIVYSNDSLESLRQYLVVTAYYDDNTNEVVTDYTLSGTLAEGTSTITASYYGESATFNVNCSVDGWLYHFEQSLLSSGSEDFGWTGPEYYDTGHDGTGYCYKHAIINEVDQGCIKSTSIPVTPDLSGDFTIAGWNKCDSTTANNLYILCAYKYNSSASSSNVNNAISSVSDLANGWSADTSGNTSARYKGARFQSSSGAILISLFANNGSNRIGLKLTPPSGFTTQNWHHYAITRKSGTIRVFVDGAVICTFTYTKAIAFSTQVTTAATFKADGTSDFIEFVSNVYVDDLFIAEYCKWDSGFNTAQITY